MIKVTEGWVEGGGATDNADNADNNDDDDDEAERERSALPALTTAKRRNSTKRVSERIRKKVRGRWKVRKKRMRGRKE